MNLHQLIVSEAEPAEQPQGTSLEQIMAFVEKVKSDPQKFERVKQLIQAEADRRKGGAA